MIAKKIPRTKGTSSVARLVRYMVAAQGGIEPESWKRTSDYILDSKSTTSHGEKVGSYRVTNCGTDDPAQAATIIEATQAANTRSKADKTYHLVFSFPPGERPPLDVLHIIEDELCEVIGYADHQRISAVHIDTDHLHVHVAINKVHPTGFQNIEPFYDVPRLMEACERLEIQYGLQPTNHGLEGGTYDRLGRGRPGPEQPFDSRFREYLRKSYALAIAERPEAETYNGLRNLSGSSMAHGPQRYSELLPSHARDRVEQGRTAQPDSVRWKGNGPGGDAGEGRLIDGKAADMEAHAGVDSLIGYAAREVAPAMRRVTSWEELHSAIAEHGLEIKPRGAGMVIGDPDLNLWCKASECGRDLSAKALTDRLGSFEQDKNRQVKPGKRYSPKPRQPHPSSAALFAEYQRQRQAAILARRQGFDRIRRESATLSSGLKQWSRAQRLLVKVTGKGLTKRLMYGAIKQQSDNQRQKNKQAMAARRQALFQETTMPTWNDWLIARAGQGDLEAIEILRAKEGRQQSISGDLLTAENADRARIVLLKALKPRPRKDGTVVYFTPDGGHVIDRAGYVQARKATAGAALAALSLAAERFEGQPLIVEGTDEFRQNVARLAGLHGVDARFSDPEMEAARLAAQRGQAKNATPASDIASTTASTEVMRWIATRNESRSKISSIHYNRLWTEQDAGKAIYQGHRRMQDGSEVILLQRDNVLLVKPASARVIAKAAVKWKVGRVVHVDQRGRFINDSKRQESEK